MRHQGSSDRGTTGRKCLRELSARTANRPSILRYSRHETRDRRIFDPSESPGDQPRPGHLRHRRRNRRGPGGRPLVFPGRRRGGQHREDDVGLRHAGQRPDLRQERPLCVARARRGNAPQGIPSARRAARRRAREPHAIFRVRRHGCGAQLHRHQRLPRLDRPALPDRAGRRAERYRPARQHAGPDEPAPAGGARHPRHQPDLRRVPYRRVHARIPAGAAGRPELQPHRDRHGARGGAGAGAPRLARTGDDAGAR